MNACEWKSKPFTTATKSCNGNMQRMVPSGHGAWLGAYSLLLLVGAPWNKVLPRIASQLGGFELSMLPWRQGRGSLLPFPSCVYHWWLQYPNGAVKWWGWKPFFWSARFALDDSAQRLFQWRKKIDRNSDTAHVMLILLESYKVYCENLWVQKPFGRGTFGKPCRLNLEDMWGSVLNPMVSIKTYQNTFPRTLLTSSSIPNTIWAKMFQVAQK